MGEWERAQEAKKLLEHPLLQEAFETMRKTCVDAWQQTPALDFEARERAWYQIHAVNEVERFLRIAVERGRMEELRAQVVR